MGKMTGSKIRKAFLKFFEERDHKIFKSFPLIPEDPTVLFTIAGMVPFKKYFLAPEKPEISRAASSQKCLRTNDLENVGKTARHHTFFEMLGNFSFGDYFKEEAIAWAWKLVTKIYGLDPKNTWITVYRDDGEAFEIWKKVGVPPERILKMGEETNFWTMGETGPCGPCSEIIYDQGPSFPTPPGCENPAQCDSDRFLEIWNLVFTQFDRQPDGSLKPLPKKNIDTGMGLERITAVIQGTPSNFETDLLFPIIQKAQELFKVPYEENITPYRVLADHARAVTFLVADGVLPSNEGRGYVLRRILRRAYRYGVLLGAEKPFIYLLAPTVAQIYADEYPELEEKLKFITTVVNSEESRFAETLIEGLSRLGYLIKKAKEAGEKTISGKEIFKLYDTYGFPVEIAEQVLSEEGMTYSKEEFDEMMEKQREMARLAWEEQAKEFDIPPEVITKHEKESTPFVGYESLVWRTTIRESVTSKGTDSNEEKGDAWLLLEETPFYATSGGQVADTGTIELEGEGISLKVVDVKKVGNLIFHRVVPATEEISEGWVSIKEPSILKGKRVIARVDAHRRKQTARHHTTTHLLQAALRRVLGTHVEQAGSLVAPDRLRFDFTHFQKPSEASLKEIEDMVNDVIYADIPVETFWTEIEKAKKMGAMALFGEKYGKNVRVVKIGDFSIELCGGTHLLSTGEAGGFHIISESAISAGVRRIEAIAGWSLNEHIARLERTLEDIAEKIKAPVSDVLKKTESLLKERSELEKELRKWKERALTGFAESISVKTSENGIKFITEALDLDSESLRSLADILRSKGIAGVLIGKGERPVVIAFIPEQVAKEKKAKAVEIVRDVARVLGGGGGGRETFAQGGGSDPSRIPEALSKAEEILGKL